MRENVKKIISGVSLYVLSALVIGVVVFSVTNAVQPGGAGNQNGEVIPGDLDVNGVVYTEEQSGASADRPGLGQWFSTTGGDPIFRPNGGPDFVFGDGDVIGPIPPVTTNSIVRFADTDGKNIKGSGPSFTFDGDTLNLPFDTASQHITIGASADLSLDHDGVNSHIINNTGELIIQNTANPGDLLFKLGSTGPNTNFQVIDSASTILFAVDGDGDTKVLSDLFVTGKVIGAGASGDLTLSGATNSPTGGDINYNGGSGGNNGGSHKFTTGTGNNIAGNFEFVASESPNGKGGSYSFIAGLGAPDDGSGAGGGYDFNAGDGGFDSGDGGSYNFTTGSTQGGSGSSGSFTINIGADGGGGIGDIILAPTVGNVGIGTASPNAKLDVVGTVKVSDDFTIDTDLLFADKSNGTVTIGNATTGTDRFNVFGPGTGAQQGIMSLYNSSGNIKFRFRDEITGTTPPRMESESSLGMAFNTTTAKPIIWYINGVANEKMRIDSNGFVGIGTVSPNAQLEVAGTAGTTIGGFASGQFHVTSDSASVNANAVITGHNLFGGNKQLWYLGSSSSSNDDITLINRQNANLTFFTNNLERLKITADGLVQTDNLQLDGNTISTTSGDLDITTTTGGVFKFISNAFQSGQDSSNYIEIGHGGSNSFLNQVGAGGMDFRFGGTTKATFTSAGHLHLMSDTDQKHNLKIITSNNANATGLAWENSGGNFSQTIFRDDIGSNLSDLYFAIGSNADIDLLTNAIRIDGSVADLADVEFFKDLKLTAYPNTRDDGTPINILGTDANGNLISGKNEVIHIGGNFVDTTDQAISIASTAQEITFNTNSLIDDISHTTGSATFTINTDGVYNIIVAPQLAQGSGSATVEFWLEKNGTDIANSNVQVIIAANSESLPLLRWKESFDATDTFKVMWASNSTNTLLDNITSSYSGPNIPSIMLGVTHQGS